MATVRKSSVGSATVSNAKVSVDVTSGAAVLAEGTTTQFSQQLGRTIRLVALRGTGGGEGDDLLLCRQHAEEEG
jgi:hypothetical protein